MSKNVLHVGWRFPLYEITFMALGGSLVAGGVWFGMSVDNQYVDNQYQPPTRAVEVSKDLVVTESGGQGVLETVPAPVRRGPTPERQRVRAPTAESNAESKAELQPKSALPEVAKESKAAALPATALAVPSKVSAVRTAGKNEPFFSFQVGVYLNPDRAKDQTKTLQDAGLPAFMKIHKINGRTLHYVYIGKFMVKQSALNYQAELNQKAGVKSVLTSLR